MPQDALRAQLSSSWQSASSRLRKQDEDFHPRSRGLSSCRSNLATHESPDPGPGGIESRRSLLPVVPVSRRGGVLTIATRADAVPWLQRRLVALDGRALGGRAARRHRLRRRRPTYIATAIKTTKEPPKPHAASFRPAKKKRPLNFNVTYVQHHSSLKLVSKGI